MGLGLTHVSCVYGLRIFCFFFFFWVHVCCGYAVHMIYLQRTIFTRLDDVWRRMASGKLLWEHGIRTDVHKRGEHRRRFSRRMKRDHCGHMNWNKYPCYYIDDKLKVIIRITRLEIACLLLDLYDKLKLGPFGWKSVDLLALEVRFKR